MFVDAVHTGKTPLVTAEDGMLALKVAHEIMEKIQQQKLSL